MRRFPPAPRHASSVRLVVGVVVAVVLAFTTISAQIPGRNVNMVSGTTWPEGDPYLQRQNEPSAAASTRNPLHLLAGANDYRTVDLPGLAQDETGDAWLGLYKSLDGGQRWTSTLLPGYLQDKTNEGMTSPIHGYGAGADPVVRAGTSGLMYYAGLVFDRSNAATPDIPGKSAIFVARFIDNNNREAGDPFHYLGTRTMQTDPGGATGNFLDKPWMVVDIPRDNSRCTIVTPGEKGPITQSVPAGPVYVAYTLRSTDTSGPRYDIMFTRSVNCGDTWTAPIRLNDLSQRANQGASMAIDPRNGNVYIGWRQFDLSTDNSGTDALMVAKFTLGGKKLGKPEHGRKFPKPPKDKKIVKDKDKFFKKGGVNAALEAAQLSPLDQSTSALRIRFRTNAYPSMTVDELGRVYLVWAERGFDPNNPDPVLGSARVLIASSIDGATWTDARPVSNENQPGHQLMPSLTYAGGRLMLIYYDIRETRSQSFTQFIDDKSSFDAPGDGDPKTNSSGLRHTIDLRASMGTPGATPVFAPSVAVSEYIEGPRTAGGANVPWQVNPPNLPMFQMGTAPFIGDYVDITAAPSFIVNAAGDWTYNTAASVTPPIFHAMWTDNRDVRVPLVDINGDGNPWNDYTPVGTLGGTPSIFDPDQFVPQCEAGNAGSRNQNVYTARITGGLLVGSPGNSKRLGFRLDENGTPQTELIQRSFVVFAQNTSDETKRFRFTIASQPVGGRASFDQFSAAPLTSIDAEIPYRSTASRTVYATSTDPHAVINISVAELMLVNGAWQVKSGGLAGVIILNPDIDNPDIDNPDIDNPDIDNPDIDNAEVYNPDIDNPDIDNPDIDNPDIDNPDIDNPDIDNIRVANPDIDNPDIDNPDIDNPDIDNPDIDNPDIDNAPVGSLMTDVTWSITNTGNTTASYNINLFFAEQTYDPLIRTQLILYRTYKTPVVRNCELKTETQNVLVANIPNPQLVTPTGGITDSNDPEITNATIYLAPGETAKITLRVFDPSPDPGSVITVTNPDGSTAKISSAFVPNEDVTPVIQQQSVNTEDVDAGVTEPPILPAPQTTPDSATTAVNTPVTFNVLANDSSAFGSTKVISFHPEGMGSHSGGTAGDLAYQPSSGYVYTGRGAVDPETNLLAGRFPLQPGGANLLGQQANSRTGINYGRSNFLNGGITALDARPASPTFHQYLPIPPLADQVTAFAIDAAQGRLYAAHTLAISTATSATTVSVIDVNPASGTFHTVLRTIALPVGIRVQSMAVNSRTHKVWVASTTVLSSGNGGLYTIDGSNPLASAVKVANVNSVWGIAINEAANLAFASTAIGANIFALYAIDGATDVSTLIPTSIPMRFTSNEERLAVHESSGKVLMRLQDQVVIVDGQRGSPTRNTVLATIAVGRENGQADVAIDQELGLAVTAGNYDFQIDVIDLASNALATSYFPNNTPSDVTIDPIHHRAFVSVFTYVQEIELAPLALGASIPVFIESGGLLINPLRNKAYAALFTTSGAVAKISPAGFEGLIPGVNPASRYLFAERYDAADWYFFVGQGFAIPEADDPGMLLLLEGATDSVSPIVDLETPAFPFGIGIDQVSNEGYVATLSGLTHGQLIHGDLSALDSPDNGSLAQGPGGPLPNGFPLNSATSLLGFGRHVVVNPANHKVYVLQIGASPTSIAVFTPSDNIIRPLDGQAGTPLFDYQLANGGNGLAWGRAQVIRVHSGLNRVYVGFVDANQVTTRIVAIDSATDTVVGTWIGGGHSFRHTASFIAVNQASNLLYVSDYQDNTITMLDAATLAVLDTVAADDGPSAMAYNVSANRLYVSNINSKRLSAFDGSTLAKLSTVRLPLLAYFLYVDEVQGRVYTSGGDSADESGVMVVTDNVGQLGTNVSLSSVGAPAHGAAVINSDSSVTYTPAPGYSGLDQFSYNIQTPTGVAVGLVRVNVLPPATGLLALPDTYVTTTGQSLNISAPGPLGNDPSSAGASMVIMMDPEHGSLTPQPNGSFVYQPFAAYTGPDTFQYHLTSVAGVSNTVTVSITVNPATTFVVTNTNDSGAGSLRQALTTANFEPGGLISFNISGGGVKVIQPTSALPTLTQPVTIDGYTQPGAAANTLPAGGGTNATILIQLVGSSAGGGTNGLNVQGGNSTIRGLSITNFTSAGILLDAGGNNVVEGNFIGVTPAGVAAANGNNGVNVQSPNNTVGGPPAAARNLISGNTQSGINVQARTSGTTVLSAGTGTVIQNNLVGTNMAGLAAMANSNNGISVGVPNVTIGGTTAAVRNVISGNGNDGVGSNVLTTGSPQILLTAPTNLVVQGNYVGVGVDGSTRVANARIGVVPRGANSQIGGSVGTTPGGACTGACNVISGNAQGGLNFNSQSDNANQHVHSSASNSVAEGNFIGLNAAGTAAITNGNSPNIFVAASNVRIGGSLPSMRNVIGSNGTSSGISVGLNTFTGFPTVPSAMGDHVLIAGNYIGLNSAGTAAMPNTTGINVNVPFATIGGNTIVNSTGNGIFAGGNTAAGNPAPVLATAHHLVLQSNRIGIAPDGVTAMPNATGASINGADSIIGGTTDTSPNACTGVCNLISGNTGTGLSVGNHFQNSGAANDGQVYSSADRTIIQGNFIGTNATGTAAIPNTGNGLGVFAPFVTIGGATAAAKNLVAGNGSIGITLSLNYVNATSTPVAGANNAVVQGNYVGTTVDGMLALPNNSGGININVPDVTVGGAGGARNVISGNVGTGVSSYPSRNGNTVMAVPSGLIVQNNYVGIKADGSGALRNTQSGVEITGPNSQVLGNVISGNTTGSPTSFSAGIHILTNYDSATGTIYSSPAGTVVYGNIIGLNPGGTTAMPNENGIQLNAPNVTIGGGGAGQRNIVSGNNRTGIGLNWNVTATNAPVASAAGSIVRGNYVGVNASGTALISNGFGAISSSAPSVTIGGPNAGDGNVAAGNGGGISLGRHISSGVVISNAGNSIVQGNIVGLSADGSSRLSASGTGVSVSSANNQIVGNIVSGQGVPASNSTSGIIISTAAATGNSVRGNTVGTNGSGDVGLGNAGAGISIIDASNNTVGGPTAQDRNIVVGSVNDAGIILFASATGTVSGNVVKNNYVGVKADGLTAIPNRNGFAMNVSAGGTITNNLIGGATAADRNVISGNNIAGVNIDGVAPANNQIAGNYIGVAADGVTPRGNALMGVRVTGSNNLIGGVTAAEGNLIAFNSSGGIDLTATATGNRLLFNLVYANTGLGIDLNQNGVTANDAGDGDTGANNLQNFPVLSVATNTPGPATTVTADLTSFAAGNYTIQFFASVSCDGSGNGEGERVVGHYTSVAGGGSLPFTLTEAVPVGQFITATATDALGNTSEYSQCRAVTP